MDQAQAFMDQGSASLAKEILVEETLKCCDRMLEIKTPDPNKVPEQAPHQDDNAGDCDNDDDDHDGESHERHHHSAGSTTSWNAETEQEPAAVQRRKVIEKWIDKCLKDCDSFDHPTVFEQAGLPALADKMRRHRSGDADSRCKWL